MENLPFKEGQVEAVDKNMGGQVAAKLVETFLLFHGSIS